MSFTDEQKILFDQASYENALAGFPFAPTEFWQKETSKFANEFRTNGIQNIFESHYNTRFHGIQKDDFRLYGWFLTVFYNLLRTRDTLGLFDRINSRISEAKITDKAPSMYINGKLIYTDLLFSIHDFYNIYELCPAVATEPIVVGDLGAGWGRIGHVLSQANPRATYIVFDIPSSLVVSSTTLPTLLPQTNIKRYQDSRGADELTRDKLTQHSIWILGSHDLRRVQRGAIDILINVASFQEMPPNQVNAYITIFDEVIERGWVYLRNNNFSKFGLAEQSDYSIPARWRNIFLRSTPFSQSIFEAGFNLE